MDCVGRSGGIAAIWRNTANGVVSSFHQHFINLEFHDPILGAWRLSGFYGCPEQSRRPYSEELIKHIADLPSTPWCIIGDFNDMLSHDDKKGGVPQPEWLLSGFRGVIQDCGLVDIPMEGYPYTWVTRCGTPRQVEERLDRAFRNEEWWRCFPLARVINSVAPISDHTPIVLHTTTPSPRSFRRTFRFKNMWLQEPELDGVIEKSWDDGEGLEHVQPTFTPCLDSCVGSR